MTRRCVKSTAPVTGENNVISDYWCCKRAKQRKRYFTETSRTGSNWGLTGHVFPGKLRGKHFEQPWPREQK